MLVNAPTAAPQSVPINAHVIGSISAYAVKKTIDTIIFYYRVVKLPR